MIFEDVSYFVFNSLKDGICDENDIAVPVVFTELFVQLLCKSLSSCCSIRQIVKSYHIHIVARTV